MNRICLEATLNPCILSTAVVVILNKVPLVKIGQGEGLTKWKGWAWKCERVTLDKEEEELHI